jgi:polyhydroxybutyrate depolymerase
MILPFVRRPIFSWILLPALLSILAQGCKSSMDAVHSETDANPGETVAAQMEYGGKSRDYYVHFPADYKEGQQYPLLLALHGGFGKADRVENYTHLSEKADEESFIVVYPQGLRRSWNAGQCCGAAKRQNIDDVGFLSDLIDRFVGNFSVDADQVFVTGLSNGGFMAYRMLCERPDKISAIAPIAATMMVESCTAEQPGSIIHFHSYQDEHVPYNGGSGKGPSDVYKPAVDSVLNVWADINECGIRKDTVESTSEYNLMEWRSCGDNAQMKLVVTQDGGHSWPGSSLDLPDPASDAINANDRMWKFFTDITKEE